MKKSLRKLVSQQIGRLRANQRIGWIILALVVLDQVTKLFARLYLPNNPVEILPYFWLNYVENTGAAFGILQNGNLVLIFIMISIIGYILWNWRELVSFGAWAKWGAVLILAGAIGNLFDRITLGYVVDFLDFRVWPVFNGADSFITVGACLMGISFLRHPQQKEEKK